MPGRLHFSWGPRQGLSKKTRKQEDSRKQDKSNTSKGSSHDLREPAFFLHPANVKAKWKKRFSFVIAYLPDSRQ